MRNRFFKLSSSGSTVFKSGLPINSLPGWEHIPLNSKLPMLKCPQNQVIFSKTKIGQTLTYNCYRESQVTRVRPDFDTSVSDSKPEYNALHDPHLKNFYANERNLKRLRQNGEITDDNDVICSLREFNQYRQQLYRVCSNFKNARMNYRDSEDRDRKLIERAESITRQDYQNLEARMHGFNEIRTRKDIIDEERHKRYQMMWDEIMKKMKKIDRIRHMQREAARRRQAIIYLKMERIQEIREDIARKRLNKLKSHLKDKDRRLQRNLRNMKKKIDLIKAAKEQKSWELRLAQRVKNQEDLKYRHDSVASKKAMFIKQHMDMCRERWNLDKIKLKERAKKRMADLMRSLYGIKTTKKKRKSKKKTKAETLASFCQIKPNVIYNKIIDDDLTFTLNVVLDMEANKFIPLSYDDPTYKAAEFILKEIINTFKKDLSNDTKSIEIVSEAIRNFIRDAKSFVSYSATKIYTSLQRTKICKDIPCMEHRIERSLGSKCVSFSNILNTIGISSYPVHPCQIIKRTSQRTPTPAGSFASIVLGSEEDIKKKTTLNHLCRNEIIYIEHMIVKFMRELIVRMEKRVFDAIRYHFEGKIYDVRRDLLNVEDEYLVLESAKAILKHAKDPIDYECAIIFCGNVLSSAIIYSLQNTLLHTERDPRHIVQPHCDKHRDTLCLFYENNYRCKKNLEGE